MPENLDSKTVAGFGYEWTRFDQAPVIETGELERLFQEYFKIFPWSELPDTAVGFDLGCGTGRWARFVAPRAGRLHCIDASPRAISVATRNLREFSNCFMHLASVDSMPLEDNSMDFGYSLGVLHHLPDTAAGIRSCVAKLKHGAPFLLYLYYAFDNSPTWFRLLWRVSDLFRRGVSRSPHWARSSISELIAAFVYFPLARFSRVLEKRGFNVRNIPLSYYRHRSYYVMRTDALDRFGTRLERRFTSRQIRDMMTHAGLERISFSDSPPYWCAVGFKAS